MWHYSLDGPEDLPPDIKALLEQQGEEDQMGPTQDNGQDRLEPESSMIFGSRESPEDLQALPKVSTGRMRNAPPHAGARSTNSTLLLSLDSENSTSSHGRVGSSPAQAVRN